MPALEKPPIFGMAQRSGEAVIRLLGNVQQKTIKPLILQTAAAETLMRADEYSIYSRLTEWGYGHKTVNHSAGEYARDEDGDGFHEVHANTLEGLWPLLRSWLRPHRSISQDKLPHAWAFSSSPATSSGAASACFLRRWGACSKRPQNPYRAYSFGRDRQPAQNDTLTLGFRKAKPQRGRQARQAFIPSPQQSIPA
jgi:hypothetical protein